MKKILIIAVIAAFLFTSCIGLDSLVRLSSGRSSSSSGHSSPPPPPPKATLVVYKVAPAAGLPEVSTVIINGKTVTLSDRQYYEITSDPGKYSAKLEYTKKGGKVLSSGKTVTANISGGETAYFRIQGNTIKAMNASSAQKELAGMKRVY